MIISIEELESSHLNNTKVINLQKTLMTEMLNLILRCLLDLPKSFPLNYELERHDCMKGQVTST